MASVQAVAERRQNAIARINAVTNGLRTQAGVNVEQQTISAKDTELAAVMHLENAAAVLEAAGSQIGLKREDGGAAGVPDNHKAHPTYPFVNEYHAPRETPQQASQRQTQQVQRAGEEVVEFGPDGAPIGDTTAAGTDESSDDETDQSDAAKARRAHRASEHRTSKK